MWKRIKLLLVKLRYLQPDQSLTSNKQCHLLLSHLDYLEQDEEALPLDTPLCITEVVVAPKEEKARNIIYQYLNYYKCIIRYDQLLIFVFMNNV